MTRTIDFRVDVLRGGVKLTELTFSTSSPPSVFGSAESEIALSMRGAFLRNPEVDYMRDELRPMILIDGEETPAGVFRVASMQETHTAAGLIYDQIEAYDRSIALKWAKLEHRDHWAAGSSYDEVISHYLTAAGIRRASFTPSPHVLQTDREEWDVGTSYLTIVNTLLSEINYQPLWFDVSGVAQIRPYQAPAAENVRHRYGVGDGVRLISPSFSAELDIFSRPNVIVCILENPEYPEPLYAVSVNDFAASRLSTLRRGLRIPKIVKVDNIASAEELQAYADKLRNESMQASEYLDIRTGIQPGHNVGDTVALTGLERDGLYREVSWQFEMAAGRYMTHRLEKAVIL